MTLLRASASLATDGLAAYRWGRPGLGGMAPWQRSAHADVARLRALIAANQIGKSRWGSSESWWHATGTHPWRRIERHEGLGWVCVGTWGKPYQQVCRNLMATCPRDLVDWGRTEYVEQDNRFVNHQIVMRDGFTIRFVSTRGLGSTSVASGTVDWLWIDEPPIAPKWGELMKRASRWTAPIWMTFTPWDATQDLDWLQLIVEGDAETGKAPEAPWSIHRVPFLPAYVPWMEPADVYADRALVRPEESPIRNDGHWKGAVAGRYFSTYGPPYNALPTTEQDGAPWQIHVGADYGEGAGKTAVPISAQRRRADGLPEIRFLAEYVSTAASNPDQDAAGIRQALKGLGLDLPDVARWTGDTNTLGKAAPGARVNAALAAALLRSYNADPANKGRPLHRLHIEDADKRAGAPDTGWMLLAMAISMGLVHIDAARCPHLHRALERWRGQDDEHKHVLDGARYQTYELLTDTLGRTLGSRASRLY